MADIKLVSSKIEEALKANKIEKATWQVSETETREINAENGEFNLYRTLFNNSIYLKVFVDNKVGTITGNDVSDEGIEKMIKDALASCESAVPDEAFDIAPMQKSEVISKGVQEPDMELFHKRLNELIVDIKKEFPQAQIMMVMGTHTKLHEVFRNTNGVSFEVFDGYYSPMIEFAGNDGTNTTGIDGAGLSLIDLSKPFMECGSIRKHLEDAVASLQQIKVSEKYDGTVIFTPECAMNFLFFLKNGTISDGVILDGTSLWKDKVGEKVVSEKLTFKIDPSDERIIGDENISDDGYRTKPLTIIEKGVLKNLQLSLYVANKTGRKCAENTSNAFIVDAGDVSFKDMIKNVKKGLIVGAFSGGHPSTSGDFSGVAKNAFYVENGEIKGAVMETMINGNIMEMLNHIEGISKETLNDGGMVMPYIACSGITISGK